MHDVTKTARQQTTYVMGHRNPDTDAICSAIGYADFLRRTRIPGAKAACCGGINARTEWVLEQAGMDPPPVIMDVRPTAGSTCHRNVVTASPFETFFDVYRRISKHRLRAVPVLDSSQRVQGIVQLSSLLELVMPPTDTKESPRAVETSVMNISQALEAQIIVPGRDAMDETRLIMTVGGSTKSVMSERIAKFDEDELIVIVGNRPEIHEMAIERKVRCIILTGGAQLAEGLAQPATEAGINVLTTARDTGSTVQLIRCSRKVATAIETDFISFAPSALVSAVAKHVRSSAQPIFPVIDPEDGKLIGVLAKSDLVDVPRQPLVLVDHNEFSQAVHGADEAEILEVLDHHRLSGNLVTKEPVRFINEPVGSTSTMVASSYRDYDIDPSQGIAVCLAAGIISDTLKLTSPTTTDVDRDILSWLGIKAKIDINQFALNFFAEGSVLREKTPAEAIGIDRKEYEENGWQISISQIEELGLERFWELREELEKELQQMVDGTPLDFACVMVTDITLHDSVLLTAGHETIIDAITYPEVKPDVFQLDGVVSRKKQLFPELSRLLAQVPKTEDIAQ